MEDGVLEPGRRIRDTRRDRPLIPSFTGDRGPQEWGVRTNKRIFVLGDRTSMYDDGGTWLLLRDKSYSENHCRDSLPQYLLRRNLRLRFRGPGVLGTRQRLSTPERFLGREEGVGDRGDDRTLPRPGVQPRALRMGVSREVLSL